MSNSLSAVAVALFSLVAAAEPRWGLKWKAPDACIGAAELSRAVDTKLGRPAFGADADFRIDGVAEGTEGKWSARLTLVNKGGDILGNREVTSSEKSCRSLDGKLTAILALMIESGPPSASESPAPHAEAPRAEAHGDDATFVHIDVENTKVRLTRIDGMSYGRASNGVGVSVAHTEEVCSSPCDKMIDRASSQFFVGSDDIVASAPFRLDGFPNGVNLKVTYGSNGLRFLGLMMAIVIGPMALIGGVVMLPLALALPSYFGDLLIPGIITAVAGAGVLAGGIVLMVNNTTKVETSPRAASALKGAAPARENDIPVSVSPMTLARF